jgi:hypothetical protein
MLVADAVFQQVGRSVQAFRDGFAQSARHVLRRGSGSCAGGGGRGGRMAGRQQRRGLDQGLGQDDLPDRALERRHSRRDHGPRNAKTAHPEMLEAFSLFRH